MPCVVQGLGSTVDVGYVLRLVGFLELSEGILYSTLLVCRNLVTVLLEVLLTLEDKGIGSVDLVDLLTLSLVCRKKPRYVSSAPYP